MIPDDDIDNISVDDDTTSDRGSNSSDSNKQEGSPRRSTRARKQPNHLKDYEVQPNPCTVTSCFLSGSIVGIDPSCYKESQGILEWENAMQEEISALEKNNTWELVPKPIDTDLVTCKWVYKLKKKADGTIDRYKARLVTRGFSQNYGLDYEETFSPVAKMVTVRSVISFAAHNSWNLWQYDVKNAFIYSELDREIFME